jgi:alpha-mannosidase
MKALLLTLLALGFAHAGQQKNRYQPHIDHSHHWKQTGFLQGDDNTQQANGTQLYVHLIAHSHDDLGWKKTVDGYFSGGRPDIQNAYVEMTLDTTIAELIKDPKRKYTQVEMKFF